jgi:Sulfotransferase domain
MITIVSGLPRSGTSLMMQMLAAGGMPVLSDGERKADTDNPRGYLEWERVKQLPKNPSLIAEGEGKVVKVISQLLLSLPDGHEYRVLFMQRPLAEVLKSQEEMMRRRGTYDAKADNAPIAAAFERHLAEVDRWFSARSKARVLRIPYHRVLQEPQATAESVVGFLNTPLNVEAMVGQVDPQLYRNRLG